MTVTNDTISLGGRQFALRPLTLGELRPVLDALDAASGASGGGLIDAAARLLLAGLAPSNPGLQLDDILGLGASLDDANAAVATILGAAGLVPAGEPMPAGAGAQESRSPASTAPSPPDAATTTAPSAE